MDTEYTILENFESFLYFEIFSSEVGVFEVGVLDLVGSGGVCDRIEAVLDPELTELDFLVGFEFLSGDLDLVRGDFDLI